MAERSKRGLPFNFRINGPEERPDLRRSLAVQRKTPAGPPAGLTHPGLERVLAVPAEHSTTLGDPKGWSDSLVIATADVAVDPNRTHDD